MPRLSSSFRQHFAKQREFIFGGHPAQCGPTNREDIFDSVHIVSRADRIIDLLKNFKRYRSAKAKFGGGAVFYGPSGTGKTMMARYVATRSGARFIDVRQFPVVLKSGVHIWQPHDIQNLFRLCEEWARKNNSPAVLFLDQFDDWIKIHVNVMSQLEIELDGFSGRREGVYLIVTGKEEPEKFGGSLFRSGRIETRIAFSLPDRRQQVELMRGFLSKYPSDPKIDIGNLVYLLSSPSHADLKSYVDEAYTCAVREMEVDRMQRGKKNGAPKAKITEQKLIEVLMSKILDDETGHTTPPEEERVSAIHEVGHYIVARALGIPAHFVSCRVGLNSLGMTFVGDNGLDRKCPSIEETLRTISVFTAGIESEELFGVPPTVGGQGDNRIATAMAKTLLSTGVGSQSSLMKEYGIFYFRNDYDEEDEVMPELSILSEDLRSAFEKEVVALLRREQRRARTVMRFFGKDLVGKIADALIKKPGKIMLRGELDRLLEPRLGQFKKKHGIVELK